MALTAADLKARWPEFADVEDAIVTQEIASATARVDDRIFGAATDFAIGLRACHQISRSQFGQQARREGGETSVYDEEFARLARELAGGPHLAGTPPTISDVESWWWWR